MRGEAGELAIESIALSRYSGRRCLRKTIIAVLPLARPVSIPAMRHLGEQARWSVSATVLPPVLGPEITINRAGQAAILTRIGTT